jgi:hypothetical protein
VNKSPIWLTIPVGNDINRRIFEVQLPSNSWRDKHIKSITYAYAKAPYFHLIESCILPIIQNKSINTLSELNQTLITTVSKDIFNLQADFYSLTEGTIHDNPSKRIAEIVKSLKGTTYISGPSASNYLDGKDFADASIALEFTNYGGLESKSNIIKRESAMLSIVHGIAWHGKNALKVIGGLE